MCVPDASLVIFTICYGATMAILHLNTVLDARLLSLGVNTCFVYVIRGRIKNQYPSPGPVAAPDTSHKAGNP